MIGAEKKPGITAKLKGLVFDYVHARQTGNRRATERAYASLYTAAMGSRDNGSLVKFARKYSRDEDNARDLAQEILADVVERSDDELLNGYFSNIIYRVKKRGLERMRATKNEVYGLLVESKDDEVETLKTRHRERDLFESAQIQTPEAAAIVAEVARQNGVEDVTFTLHAPGFPSSHRCDADGESLEPGQLRVLGVIVDMALAGIAFTVPALTDRVRALGRPEWRTIAENTVRKYISDLRKRGWVDADGVVVREYNGQVVPRNPRVRVAKPEHGLQLGQARALTAYVSLVRETGAAPSMDAVIARVEAEHGHRYKNGRALLKALTEGGFVHAATGAVLRTIDGSEVPTLKTMLAPVAAIAAEASTSRRRVQPTRRGPVRRMGHKPVRPMAKVIPLSAARPSVVVGAHVVDTSGLSTCAVRVLGAVSTLTAEMRRAPEKAAVRARIALDTGHEYTWPAFNRVVRELRMAGHLDPEVRVLRAAGATGVRVGDDVAIVPTGAPPTSVEKTGTDDLPVQVDVVIDGVVEDTLPTPTLERVREIERQRESLKRPDRPGVEVPARGIFGKLTMDTHAAWTAPMVASGHTLDDVVPAPVLVAPVVVDAPWPRGWDDDGVLPAWMIGETEARERPPEARLYVTASHAPGVTTERESGSADPPREAPDGAVIVKADDGRRAQPMDETCIAERLLSYARDVELDPNLAPEADELIFPDEDDPDRWRPRTKRVRSGRRTRA